MSDRTSFTPYSAFDIPADLRELHGRYDVEATARRVRNFRYAEEWIMMILSGWVATIPEIPVKTGLGKVIWESATAADALGKRLPELRCGRKDLTRSEAGNQGFAQFIEAVAAPEAPEQTIEKLAGVFDVLKPHLVALYEQHMRETDAISDAPTIEILDEITRRARAHIAWGGEVLDRLCDAECDAESGHARRRARADELTRALRTCGGATGEWPGGQEPT